VTPAVARTWWEEHGYLRGKPIGDDGLWICLAKMMFTYRLMICTTDGVLDFYCYPRPLLPIALAAFEVWDGEGHPIDGWVKHHGAEPVEA